MSEDQTPQVPRIEKRSRRGLLGRYRVVLRHDTDWESGKVKHFHSIEAAERYVERLERKRERQQGLHDWREWWKR